MKKMLCIGLALACVLGLVGCGGSGNPNTSENGSDKVIALVQTVEKTDEELTGLLKGVSRETMAAAWGNPDGMLSGFMGDMWYTGVGCRYVVVYYEENAKGEVAVVSVKLGEDPGVLRGYAKKTQEGETAQVADFGMLNQEQAKRLKQVTGNKSRWVMDHVTDRIPFFFDGEFMLAGDDTVYLVSFDQGVIYASGAEARFCHLTNAELAMLRAYFQKVG